MTYSHDYQNVVLQSDENPIYIFNIDDSIILDSERRIKRTRNVLVHYNDVFLYPNIFFG